MQNKSYGLRRKGLNDGKNTRLEANSVVIDLKVVFVVIIYTCIFVVFEKKQYT